VASERMYIWASPTVPLQLAHRNHVSIFLMWKREKIKKKKKRISLISTHISLRKQGSVWAYSKRMREGGDKM
jgi:hypothetical protein